MSDGSPSSGAREQGAPPVAPGSDDPGAEVEQFLYIVTHDLRASFRAFQTIPDWIREDMGPLPPDRAALVSEHLDMLAIQAARADRMLLDLRDYSRVGRMAEPSARHSLSEILTRSEHLFALPDTAHLHVAGQARFTGPGNELAMLFAALLSNAVKHHDRPQCHIEVTLAPSPPLVEVTLRDDGPGIPERFREVVFDPLRTLRPRDQCEGSGMGLSIARKIVTRLGGTIRITGPEPEGADAGADRGTALVFTLPGEILEEPPPPRLN